MTGALLAERQVVVGEAVSLDLPAARLPSRAIAAVIDLALQVAALIAVLTPTLAAVRGYNAAAAVIAAVLAVAFGYPFLSETLWRGRTVGKAAMGLRVVRDDAGPITARHAFVRALLGLFVEKPGLAPLLGIPVATVVSVATERGKRLGDLLAGTYVVNERVPRVAYAPVVMPPPLAGWAAIADLSAVRADLALAARSFLNRRASLTAAARRQLGDQLAGALAAVVAPPPPAGAPAEAVLAAVLAERRRREELRLGVPPGAPDAAAWLGGSRRSRPVAPYGGRPPRPVAG